MKWIHQVDSAFSSIIMYSPTDHFVAFAEAHNHYSCDMVSSYDYNLSSDEIDELLHEWLARQDSQMVRLIAATGQLRAMIRDIEPSLFQW